MTVSSSTNFENGPLRVEFLDHVASVAFVNFGLALIF